MLSVSRVTPEALETEAECVGSVAEGIDGVNMVQEGAVPDLGDAYVNVNRGHVTERGGLSGGGRRDGCRPAPPPSSYLHAPWLSSLAFRWCFPLLGHGKRTA